MYAYELTGTPLAQRGAHLGASLDGIGSVLKAIGSAVGKVIPVAVAIFQKETEEEKRKAEQAKAAAEQAKAEAVRERSADDKKPAIPSWVMLAGAAGVVGVVILATRRRR